MNKKRIMIITIFIIVSLFTYKMYLVNKSNLDRVSYENDVSGLINNKTVEVKKVNINENESFIVKNIEFKNIFESYELESEKSNDNNLWYKVKKYNGQESYLGVGVDSIEYIDFTELTIDDGIYNVAEFYKKENIKNDIDLLEYLISYEENNIFTSKYDINSSYCIRVFYSDLFKDYKNLEIFTGDLVGYKIDTKYNSTEVSFYKDGKLYGLNFIDKTFFTEEDILNIINTITIN